jgi:hypothetical protein
MRFSMSIGPDGSPPRRSPTPTTVADVDAPAIELRLLEAQLERMRGMLFGYSSLFFATIRTWTIACLGLLVLGWSGVLPAAVVPVPFLVPFAFLETGYLFWYTVFARRHAERLEQAINERLGREVLVAHRLEAAYFYPPDAPKIAGLSLGNPFGFMSAATLGYTVGGGLLWMAGLASAAAYVRSIGGGFLEGGLLGLVIPAAVAWTAAIAAYLVWSSLRRADEDRLLAALDAAYGPRASSPPDAPASAAAEPTAMAGPGAPIDAGPPAADVPPPPAPLEDR